MFKIFELVSEQPTPTLEAIMTFKELYDRDSSKDKSRFYQEMSYIYFMYDHRSYYNSYLSHERLEHVKKDYIRIPNWKPDDVVERAVKKYKELQKTESLGLLEDSRFGLEKVREYYRNFDTNKRDVKGNPIYKITELTKSIGDISKMIESIEKLKEKVIREEELNSSVRGGGTIGLFEES